MNGRTILYDIPMTKTGILLGLRPAQRLALSREELFLQAALLGRTKEKSFARRLYERVRELFR